MSIRVDTVAIIAAADDITVCNQVIDDAFAMVEMAVDGLNRCWEGEASEEAYASFQTICSDHRGNRFAAMDNLAQYLRRVVGQGYEQIEMANISLADAFL